MKGLDLSKFKKVGSTDTHTTFKHEDGHWIKVAHGGLTSKMRGDISRLPMAEGGKVKDEDPKDAFSKGFTASTGSAAISKGAQNVKDAVAPPKQPQAQTEQYEQDTPQYAEGTPEAPIGATGGTVDSTASGDLPDAPPAQQQESFPPLAIQGQGQQQDQEAPPEQGPSGLRTYLDKSEQQTAQDLAQGHIKPQTYRDLYEKKDTLGKIGTLFGLMMGGIGSGLTHQPNALTEMMNKEIERDLEAQKNSAANAQNFLRIRQQDPEVQAQARLHNVSANQIAQTMAYTDMANTSFKEISDKVAKMPDSDPRKASWQQALMLTVQNMGPKLNNAKDMTAAMAGGINPASGGPAQQSEAEKPAPGGIQPLLHSGSADTFRGLSLNPIAAKDYGEISSQFTTAQQADKALANLAPTFETLAKNITTSGRTEQQAGNLSSSSLNVLHGMAKVVANAQPANRAYDAAKTALLSDVINVFKGTNVSSDAIEKVINDNLPVQGDSQEAIRKKRDNIEGFIKRTTPTSMLQKYHLSNQ